VRITRILLLLPTFFVFAPLASCVAITPTSTKTSSSALVCPEFHPGSTLDANAKIDVRVRGSAQSSSDLTDMRRPPD
jgi:hypothetical protein